jgi:cephalosporin-C deacetylase-like acetyl esterase
MDRFQKVSPLPETEDPVKRKNITEIRFSFQSEEGYRIPCHLLLPNGVEKPPVMICLQGHSTGMHISLGRPKYPSDIASIAGGDRDFCIRAVKEGFAAVAMEQRSFGLCGGTEKGPQCLESAMTSLLMGRTILGERVWDIMRLIDVLESHFADKVDIHTICCMGNSGGGTATAYAAALEDRIKLAMPSCAMCTYRDSIAAMKHCSCNYVPHIGEYFDMGDLLAMAYPKYYVQVNGDQDPIFPLAGAEEVFENGRRAYADMGCEDRCAHIIGEGGHRFYADLSWPAVHQFLKK